MVQTDLCKLLKIEYPVICGGMIWCSGWRLAAAVSNEGGLGLIGAGSMTPDTLQEHIRKTRTATDKPFGVNIPLMSKDADANIKTVINESVPVVVTSAGNPDKYTQVLKSNGIKVIHVIANKKFALKAQKAGVDAIVAEGFEAGGHNGKEETTTLVLLQEIVGCMSIPVLAAGGIASGEAIAAMLALGAKGVQIGSLFAASEESSAHLNFKNAVLSATEGDTKLFFRKLSPTRLLSGGFFSKVEEAENRGATAKELLDLIGTGRSKWGMFEGDLQEGELEIGQVSSMLNELKSVKDIFADLKAGYNRAKERM